MHHLQTRLLFPITKTSMPQLLSLLLPPSSVAHDQPSVVHWAHSTTLLLHHHSQSHLSTSSQTPFVLHFLHSFKFTPPPLFVHWVTSDEKWPSYSNDHLVVCLSLNKEVATTWPLLLRHALSAQLDADVTVTCAIHKHKKYLIIPNNGSSNAVNLMGCRFPESNLS